MEAGSSHWTKMGVGDVSLQLHWKQPLGKNIALILCLEYEMVLKLDKYGQATVDYAPLY